MVASLRATSCSPYNSIDMPSSFEDIPQRIFLDSSVLQTLQDYGGFLYENEPLGPADPLNRDPNGIAKLDALRSIMQIAERAPFQFALSEASFEEVRARNDCAYLRWAYDILDHWMACLEESGEPRGSPGALAAIDTNAYGYLSAGDRRLLWDAIALDCDCFLTMETRLPRNSEHIQRTLGLRVLSPITMWEILRPWAALFR